MPISHHAGDMEPRMRVNRSLFAVMCILLLGGCGSSPAGPPRLPLNYGDLQQRESTIQLDEGGVGVVENLPLAMSQGSDCQTSGTRSYSGPVDWHMVSTYQGRMTADGMVVTVQIKASFGEPDWSRIYVNSCTSDSSLGGWVTFDGGTGP